MAKQKQKRKVLLEYHLWLVHVETVDNLYGFRRTHKLFMTPRKKIQLALDKAVKHLAADVERYPQAEIEGIEYHGTIDG